MAAEVIFSNFFKLPPPSLQKKILDLPLLSDHVYKSGVPYQTFYKQYRASFLDNLRKRGDLVKYKNDYALPEDEKLSP